MLSKKLLSLVAGIMVLLLATNTAADGFPFLKFDTPAVCKTEGGSTVSLPPGRFLPEQGWQNHEKEWMALEDDNTRLTAENEVLRDQESSIGWKTVVSAILAGILIDRYALDR